MKKISIIVGIVVLVLLFLALYLPFRENVKNDLNVTTYKNEELGLEFTYKTGQEGYVLEERTPAQDTRGHFKTIILMQTKDREYLDTEGAPVGGEGPATITIDIFKNLKNQSASVWALENTQYSNINLKLEDPKEVVVDGANAVRFPADGLYASDNVVVAHGGYIFIFSGMYIDSNSQLKADFSPIIDSVKFVEPSTQINAKINIDVVCRNALTFMLFKDGASADKFLEECKEGKHPDVIDNYIKNMGLDGATI